MNILPFSYTLCYNQREKQTHTYCMQIYQKSDFCPKPKNIEPKQKGHWDRRSVPNHSVNNTCRDGETSLFYKSGPKMCLTDDIVSGCSKNKRIKTYLKLMLLAGNGCRNPARRETVGQSSSQIRNWYKSQEINSKINTKLFGLTIFHHDGLRMWQTMFFFWFFCP